jgi:hypothetical protein
VEIISIEKINIIEHRMTVHQQQKFPSLMTFAMYTQNTRLSHFDKQYFFSLSHAALFHIFSIWNNPHWKSFPATDFPNETESEREEKIQSAPHFEIASKGEKT